MKIHIKKPKWVLYLIALVGLTAIATNCKKEILTKAMSAESNIKFTQLNVQVFIDKP